MKRTHRATHPRQLRNAWAYVASIALALFTVFVLLDTFAIARVQRTAVAADYSSIVAAQSNGESGASSAQDGGESEAESRSGCKSRVETRRLGISGYL